MNVPPASKVATPMSRGQRKCKPRVLWSPSEADGPQPSLDLGGVASHPEPDAAVPRATTSDVKTTSEGSNNDGNDSSESEGASGVSAGAELEDFDGDAELQMLQAEAKRIQTARRDVLRKTRLEAEKKRLRQIIADGRQYSQIPAEGDDGPPPMEEGRGPTRDARNIPGAPLVSSDVGQQPRPGGQNGGVDQRWWYNRPDFSRGPPDRHGGAHTRTTLPRSPPTHPVTANLEDVRPSDVASRVKERVEVLLAHAEGNLLGMAGSVTWTPPTYAWVFTPVEKASLNQCLTEAFLSGVDQQLSGSRSGFVGANVVTVPITPWAQSGAYASTLARTDAPDAVDTLKTELRAAVSTLSKLPTELPKNRDAIAAYTAAKLWRTAMRVTSVQASLRPTKVLQVLRTVYTTPAEGSLLPTLSLMEELAVEPSTYAEAHYMWWRSLAPRLVGHQQMQMVVAETFAVLLSGLRILVGDDTVCAYIDRYLTLA